MAVIFKLISGIFSADILVYDNGIPSDMHHIISYGTYNMVHPSFGCRLRGI